MGLKAIDLFSGGGGASLGLLNVESVELLGGVDVDDNVREYYNENLPVESIGLDLRNPDALNIISDRFEISADEIDLVMGCPPCQEYSSLQDTTPGDNDTSKGTLLEAYLDLILEIRPDVFVFENVPGLLSGSNEKHIETLIDQLEDVGYGVDLDVLNMADYGVPQNRKRTIAVGINGVNSEMVSLPERTHSSPQDSEGDKPNWKSVEEVIGDLPVLEAGESINGLPYNGHRARNHRPDTISLIKKVPPDGGSRTDLPEKDQLDCHKNLDNSSSAGNVYGRMTWDDPAPTLTGRCTSPSCGRFVHPEQHRGITPREAARLMTFPDSYELPESNTLAEKLIGNAVPPKFVESMVSSFLSTNEQLIFREHAIVQ